MTFQSILFECPFDEKGSEKKILSDSIKDLNLDQIINAITHSKHEYDLEPFFYRTLHDVKEIHYRHGVFRDLEDPLILASIKVFSNGMRDLRNDLNQVEKLYYDLQKESWFLNAVEVYCRTVTGLADDLDSFALKSQGLSSLRDYLSSYIKSNRFLVLSSELDELKTELSSVEYLLLIQGNTIKVKLYNAECDYSADVEKTFKKFQQSMAKDHSVKFLDRIEMNHVEAKILEFVAQLYPEIFKKLDIFFKKYIDFIDEKIEIFEREIQFYIAYLDYLESFKATGLKFCYPSISISRKTVYAYESFDLALTAKLQNEDSSVVCNDFFLRGKERIIIVSGPNQGGKTTFARMFGQLHYLACLGCPVPGRKAQLFLFDQIFTHFEKKENMENLHGKLQDDLIRIFDILQYATPMSIIILNEIFSSTTLNDSIFLNTKVIEKIIELDLICVFVTFIDELSLLGEKVVSMVSTVSLKDLTLRTYKIIRKPADGLSYAMAIAEKYGLTYINLKERLK